MAKNHGFTLIELSIVLVIIGLVIGGVLVGQDLITAAGVRGQIAQIEKYQTAANTFKAKYGFYPGDLPNPYASQFGFTATRASSCGGMTGPCAGAGDGDGFIGGTDCSMCSGPDPLVIDGGETGVFWRDLSDAKLIEGGFQTAVETNPASLLTANGVQQYLPQAKLGRGSYVYVWGGGIWSADARHNYFTIAGVSCLDGIPCGFTAMKVGEAYNIDKKIDDGLPQAGRVMAMYLSWNAIWAAGGNKDAQGMTVLEGDHDPSWAPATSAQATAYLTTNCYDNNGVAGIEIYSMKNANLVNCAVSIRFQ